MNSQSQNYPDGNAYPAQEILSDEEMRSRAAAYAQQIYEQQLEAMRQQREQILAARRAMEEYERQRRQYEDACRAYYAQQAQAQSAVRVDPATGEQTFAFQRQYAAMQENSASQENFSAESVPENFAPAEEETVSAAENSAEISPESDVPAEPGQPENFAATPEENFENAESPENENPADESPEKPAEEDPAPQASPDVPDLRKTAATQILNASAARQKSPVRNLFVLFVSAILLALLAAAGYIIFSNDPRFEVQRNNFFRAIGWENAIVETRQAAPENVPAPLPEFLPKKKPISETAENVAESVPATAPENASDGESGDVPADADEAEPDFAETDSEPDDEFFDEE